MYYAWDDDLYQLAKNFGTTYCGNAVGNDGFESLNIDNGIYTNNILGVMIQFTQNALSVITEFEQIVAREFRIECPETRYHPARDVCRNRFRTNFNRVSRCRFCKRLLLPETTAIGCEFYSNSAGMNCDATTPRLICYIANIPSYYEEPRTTGIQDTTDNGDNFPNNLVTNPPINGCDYIFTPSSQQITFSQSLCSSTKFRLRDDLENVVHSRRIDIIFLLDVSNQVTDTGFTNYNRNSLIPLLQTINSQNFGNGMIRVGIHLYAEVVYNISNTPIFLDSSTNLTAYALNLSRESVRLDLELAHDPQPGQRDITRALVFARDIMDTSNAQLKLVILFGSGFATTTSGLGAIDADIGSSFKLFPIGFGVASANNNIRFWRNQFVLLVEDRVDDYINKENESDDLFISLNSALNSNRRRLGTFVNPPKNDPTNAPTPSPTDLPTNAPTQAPTPSPTDLPTNAPTQAPTPSPTSNPTAVPKLSPIEPTQSPTSAYIPVENFVSEILESYNLFREQTARWNTITGNIDNDPEFPEFFFQSPRGSNINFIKWDPGLRQLATQYIQETCTCDMIPRNVSIVTDINRPDILNIIDDIAFDYENNIDLLSDNVWGWTILLSIPENLSGFVDIVTYIESVFAFFYLNSRANEYYDIITNECTPGFEFECQIVRRLLNGETRYMGCDYTTECDRVIPVMLLTCFLYPLQRNTTERPFTFGMRIYILYIL